MSDAAQIADVGQCIAQNDPAGALDALKAHIRQDAGNADLRMSLAALEMINGDYDKALAAADAASTMDTERGLLCQQWKLQIMAEQTRAEVFAGKTTAIVMGDPEAWIAGMQDALRMDAQGNAEAADAARRHALESAPARAGTINGTAFEWLCDADERIGPAFEAIINGRYTWVPQSVVISMHFKKPSELIDLVWSEVTIKLNNGGETAALMPARYPGSEVSDDGATRLARMTSFDTTAGGTTIGLGQRVLATDTDDHAQMTIDTIEFSA